MSRWLKSTTQKAYTVQGKVIPPCISPDNKWLKLTESEYSSIKKMPVIASLISAGGILVSLKEPEELRNTVEGLKGSNAELIARNTQLEEQLKAFQGQQTVDVEAIKAEATAAAQKASKKELDAALARIKELEAMLGE